VGEARARGSCSDGGAMEHRGEAGPVDWTLAPQLTAASTVPGAGAGRAAAAAGEEEGQDRLRVRAKGACRGCGGGAGHAAGGRRRH
jgi:hypothetical protein